MPAVVPTSDDFNALVTRVASLESRVTKLEQAQPPSIVPSVAAKLHGVTTLVWNDEFDTLSVASCRANGGKGGAKWYDGVPNGPTNPAWMGGGIAANAYKAQGSILTITLQKGQDGFNLTSDDGSGSGFFLDVNQFVEFRASLMGWDSFWSFPKDYITGIGVNPPDNSTYVAEYDFLEHDHGAQIDLTTLHKNTNNGSGVQDLTAVLSLPSGNNEWHTWGFWRTASNLLVYKDDVLTGTFQTWSSGGARGSTPGTLMTWSPGNLPLAIIIGAGRGGVLGGNSEPCPDVVTMQVDYVRVWK